MPGAMSSVLSVLMLNNAKLVLFQQSGFSEHIPEPVPGGAMPK